MGNVSGKAYALNVLSPIKSGGTGDRGFVEETREKLQKMGLNERSPCAGFPQTYLARFFILNDVFCESLPGYNKVLNFSQITSVFSDKARKNALPHEDHLKSKYLVFTSNFYGDLDTYLEGMWTHQQSFIEDIWCHCYAFDKVTNVTSFKKYIKDCQLETTLFFNGSVDGTADDVPLETQLKGLYLKQELGKFALQNQGKSAEDLLKSYSDFKLKVQVNNLQFPSWQPGQSSTIMESGGVS